MIKKISALITMIIICIGSLNVSFSEPKGRTVKIPYYNMEGFIYTDEAGVRSGYSYEIFRK